MAATVLAIVLAYLCVGCAGSSASGAARPVAGAQATTTSLGLVDQKLRAEAELARAQAEQARQAARSAHAADALWRQLLAPLATFAGVALTALVAFLAVVRPIKAQRERAAVEDANQRDKDRVQRFDTGFAAAVTALGDDADPRRIGGAVALQSYLRPELADFHRQVFLAVLANLDQGVTHSTPVRKALVDDLAVALRQSTPRTDHPPPPRTHSSSRDDGLNLARTYLRRGDFRNLDLSSCDLAFSDLTGARLDGTNLRRAWGWRVRLDGASLRDAVLEECRFQECSAIDAAFTGATLVSGRFERSCMDGARFRGARLQGAHFDGASLVTADFRDAHLDDTFFRGATLDDNALQTLLLSKTWYRLCSRTASDDERFQLLEKMRRFFSPDTIERVRFRMARVDPSPGTAPEDATTPSANLR